MSNITGSERGDSADVVDATATAIEEGLVRSIQSAYDALRALGYSPPPSLLIWTPMPSGQTGCRAIL
jgi:hypothetical protein